jgi:hypothetical protein
MATQFGNHFAAFARSLPLRRVTDPWPVREYTAEGVLLADYRDVLECGHMIQHAMATTAKKRRCYVCGPEGN